MQKEDINVYIEYGDLELKKLLKEILMDQYINYIIINNL